MTDTLHEPGPAFRWWPLTVQILAEIEEIRGAPGARIEYHPGDNHTLRFVSDQYEGPPINDSRLCPPICP